MSKIAKLLTVVIVLQAMILAGQWVGTGLVSPAQAQMADPGRDRQQLLEEIRKTNDKLDKVVEILRSGDLQVHVINPDETKAKPAGR